MSVEGLRDAPRQKHKLAETWSNTHCSLCALREKALLARVMGADAKVGNRSPLDTVVIIKSPKLLDGQRTVVKWAMLGNQEVMIILQG